VNGGVIRAAGRRDHNARVWQARKACCPIRQMRASRGVANTRMRVARRARKGVRYARYSG